MSVDPNLLEILACPECKSGLVYDRGNSVLVCNACKLAYPVTERGIPLLIVDEARPLDNGVAAGP